MCIVYGCACFIWKDNILIIHFSFQCTASNLLEFGFRIEGCFFVDILRCSHGVFNKFLLVYTVDFIISYFISYRIIVYFDLVCLCSIIYILSHDPMITCQNTFYEIIFWQKTLLNRLFTSNFRLDGYTSTLLILINLISIRYLSVKKQENWIKKLNQNRSHLFEFQQLWRLVGWIWEWYYTIVKKGIPSLINAVHKSLCLHFRSSFIHYMLLELFHLCVLTFDRPSWLVSGFFQALFLIGL